MKKSKGNILLFKTSIGLSVLYLLYAAILAPIYTAVCNDVIYIDTYLPDITELVMELINLFSWGLISASTVYVLYQYCENSKKLCTIIPLISIFRYILSIFISWIYDGMPSSSAFTLQNFGESGLYFVFDMIQFTAIVFFSNILTSKCKSEFAEAEKAAVTLGDISLSEKHNPLPLKRVFALGNKLQLSSFLGACVISSVRIAMRVRYDIFYGAPESIVDLLWIIAYYTSDIIFGLLVYILSVLLINTFYNHDEKRE